MLAFSERNRGESVSSESRMYRKDEITRFLLRKKNETPHLHVKENLREISHIKEKPKHNAEAESIDVARVQYSRYIFLRARLAFCIFFSKR